MYAPHEHAQHLCHRLVSMACPGFLKVADMECDVGATHEVVSKSTRSADLFGRSEVFRARQRSPSRQAMCPLTPGARGPLPRTSGALFHHGGSATPRRGLRVEKFAAIMERVATVSAVLTLGSSFNGEGVAGRKRAYAIPMGGLESGHCMAIP